MLSVFCGVVGDALICISMKGYLLVTEFSNSGSEHHVI